MSRGPGRVERTIRTLIREQPNGAWTTEDLADAAFPDVGQIGKRHRVSVLRAVHRIVADDPDWALDRAGTIGRTVVLHNRASARSLGLARLKGDFLVGYRNADPCARQRDTEEDLLARLDPGGSSHHLVRPGGPCDRQARLHRARRDGDEVTARAMEAQNRAEADRLLGELAALRGAKRR